MLRGQNKSELLVQIRVSQAHTGGWGAILSRGHLGSSVLVYIWINLLMLWCCRLKGKVQTNKDLNLPTQQELLAQFRCDKISAVVLSEFNEQAKLQKRPVKAGKVVQGLGAMMRDWRTTALCEFPIPISTNISS